MFYKRTASAIFNDDATRHSRSLTIDSAGSVYMHHRTLVPISKCLHNAATYSLKHTANTRNIWKLTS